MSTRRTVVNAVLLAVFALLCVSAMEVLAINIGQPNPLARDYTVKALFPDANGLPTAADVRVAGIVVGKVTGIAKDPTYPGYTVATLDIQDDRANPLYANATATVRPKTLLGEKFVDLVLGDATSDRIPNNGYLNPANGSKSVENDEIFNAFDKPTRDAQQRVIKALNDALAGRSGDLQAILPQLDTVVQNLTPVARVYEKDTPTVDSIFTNLQQVMQTLADEHTQLAGFLGNANLALQAITSRNDSLVTTLAEATRVQDEFNTVATATVADQQSSIRKLAPSLDSLHAFLDQVVQPQAACGNRPCGLVEVLSGTLTGQLNYPNDQLTVTQLCSKGRAAPDSCEGEYVTNEYDSMFSNPASTFKSGQPNSHSALNIVLSEHCDTVAVTGTLPVILGQDVAAKLNPLIVQACNGIPGSPGAATTTTFANPAATGTVLTAAMAGMTG